MGSGGRTPRFDGLCAGSLGELYPSSIDDDGQVKILRRNQAQGLLHMDMQPGRVEQIDSSHDMCDALLRIVQNDGQMIGRQAVSPEYYLISDACVNIIPARSLQSIVKAAC